MYDRIPSIGGPPERGEDRRPHILFVGEDVTLAHLARPLKLAADLKRAGYRVTLASSARHRRFVDAEGVDFVPIETMSPSDFGRRIRAGNPIHSRALLQSQVASDHDLLRRCAPDMVVGDFRVSLGVSARLAGIPFVAITNAHWSPGYAGAFPVPDHPAVRLFGLPTARLLAPLVKSATFRISIQPYNELCTKHGLRRVSSLKEMYTDADWVLYPDTPELVPVHPLPPNHTYVGPILWQPRISEPAWWAALPADRPLVYVTAGSSGCRRIAEMAVAALGDLPLTVLVAWAGATPPNSLPSNVLGAPYLPGAAAARRADLVICNGGSATGYQALAEGTPVLGLPSNADQHLTMQCMERAGAAASIRAERISVQGLRRQVLTMLNNPGLKASAHRCAREMARFDASQGFCDFVGQRFGRAASTESQSPRLAAVKGSAQTVQEGSWV